MRPLFRPAALARVLITALVAALLVPVVATAPASAATSCDVNYAELVFDNANHHPIVGDGTHLNDKIWFKNVVSADCGSLDAFVTTSAISNTLVENFDVLAANTNCSIGGEVLSKYLMICLSVDQGGYADFSFSFYLSTDVGATGSVVGKTPVVLKNVNVTGSDIDSSQFNYFTSANGYTVSNPTNLNVTTDGVSGHTVSSYPSSIYAQGAANNRTNDVKDQIVVTYASVSSGFTVRVGSNVSGQGNVALFGIAFTALGWGSGGSTTSHGVTPVSYTVTTAKTGTGTGTITPGDLRVDSGTVVTETATASTGSTFTGWSGCKTSSNPVISFTVTQNTTCTANFDTGASPATYTVTYNGNGNSGGSAPTDLSPPYSPDSTVTVLDNSGSLTRTGYTFAGWNTAANGLGTPYSASDTFAIVADTTLYAVWTPIPLIVTYSPGTGSGTLSGGDTVTVNYGDTHTVKAPAGYSKTGYHFNGWQSSGSFSAGDSVTVTAPKTFTAQWLIDTHTLTTSKTGQGSVTSGGTYNYGDTVTVTATPAAGWHFTGWAAGSACVTNPDTVTMTADRSCVATFAENAYVVTYVGNGNTVGTAPVNPNSYASGATATVATQANLGRSGYYFSGWTANADGSGAFYWPGATLTFTDHDITLYARWLPNPNVFTLVVKTVGSGSVSPAGGNYVESLNVPVTATPATGWKFTGWSGDCSGTASAVTVVMNSDKICTATFVPLEYKLTTSTNGSGSVTSGGTHKYGDVVTLTATPAAGWHFTGWSGDCAGTANPTAVTITSDKSCIANFAIGQVKLTTSTVGSGTVTPGGTYTYGATPSISATPATGWHFVGWTGDCSGASSPLTVTMTAEKSCVANFAINVLPLTTEKQGSGSVTPGGSYKYGETTTITATPAAGWKFTGWSGDCAGTTNPLTIVMDAAKSCTANFEQIVYPLTVTPAGQGSVSPNSGPYKSGDKVTITATPADGWKFTGWSGACTGTENPLTVTMDAAKECTAVFGEIPVVKNDVYKTSLNTTLNLPAGASILGNDTAGLGKVALATKTKHGTVTLAPNGKLTYKPNTGFVGVDSFKYKTYDAKGRAYVATVKLIVTPKVPKDITTGR